MANTVDPDETPQSAESHPCLHWLLTELVCPNTYSKYSNVHGSVNSHCVFHYPSFTIYNSFSAKFVSSVSLFLNLLQAIPAF